jgi:hypothetical protein
MLLLQVRSLLPYGLVPEVVPEFRRITVGGAIQVRDFV